MAASSDACFDEFILACTRPDYYFLLKNSRRQSTFTHTHTHTHIHATPHKGSSLENVTAQQTPKASPAGLYTRLAESSCYKVHSSSPGQRIRWRSLRSTNHITSQFEEARSSFSLPEAIDFVDPTLLHLWMKVLSLNTTFISEVGASAPFKLDDWDVVTKAFNDQNNRGWIA